VSFEPDKVTVHLDGVQLRLEPGRGVISHGIDRDLTVGAIAGTPSVTAIVGGQEARNPGRLQADPAAKGNGGAAERASVGSQPLGNRTATSAEGSQMPSLLSVKVG
jgi:hypothetical protein